MSRASLGDTSLFAGHSQSSNPDLSIHPSLCFPISVLALLRMGLPTSGPLSRPIVNHYALLFLACVFHGAALGRKMLGYASSQNKKHFRAVMFAGLIVLAASIIDLAISTQSNGWHNMYLLLAVTPTGLGVFLLYAGSTVRRQPVSNA